MGRTSPPAAATAVEQEPMDLVKRKPGQIGSEVQINTFNVHIPSAAEDEARQPQVSQSFNDCDSLQVSHKQQSSKVPKICITQNVPNRKQMMVSRWIRENPQFQHGDQKISSGQQFQYCIEHHTEKLKANDDSSSTLEDKLMEKVPNYVQENSKDNLQNQGFSSNQENSKNTLQKGKVIYVHNDVDQDKQIKDYVLTLLTSECPESNSHCEMESQKFDTTKEEIQMIDKEVQNELPTQVCRRVIEKDSPLVENVIFHLSDANTKVYEATHEKIKGKETVQQSNCTLQSVMKTDLTGKSTLCLVFDLPKESTEIYRPHAVDKHEEKVQQNPCMSQSSTKTNVGKDNEVDSDTYDIDKTLVIAEDDCQVIDLHNETETSEIKVKSSSINGIFKQDDEDTHESAPKNRSRSETQRKMNFGRTFLINNFQLTESPQFVIKLSDIEMLYISYCKKSNEEPLSTPVLARLIHGTYPDATKCRLGARGNQRIHYRRLQFKSDIISRKQNLTENTNEEKINDLTDDVIPDVSKKADSEVYSQSKPPQSFKGYEETVNEQTKSAINKTEDLKQNLPLHGIEGKASSYQQQNEDDPGQKDEEENCMRTAKKVKEILQWIASQGEPHKRALLRDFAHSASCQKAECEHVCLMFRRIRRHVVAAQHSCSVLRLYSMLLRHHVSSCTQANCGLPACPALRKTCSSKRKQGLELMQPAKRMVVGKTQSMYPSSLVLTPRSPGGSLPGSPVDSPPSSPNSVLDVTPLRGQVPVQYMVLPLYMPVIENQTVIKV